MMGLSSGTLKPPLTPSAFSAFLLASVSSWLGFKITQGLQTDTVESLTSEQSYLNTWRCLWWLLYLIPAPRELGQEDCFELELYSESQLRPGLKKRNRFWY